MYEYRGVGGEELRGMLYATARLEQSGRFVGDAYIETEVVVFCKIVDYLLRKVVHVDNNAVNASLREILYYVLYERLTTYPHQRLWHSVGERFKASAHSCRENHCLHHRCRYKYVAYKITQNPPNSKTNAL